MWRYNNQSKVKGVQGAANANLCIINMVNASYHYEQWAPSLIVNSDMKH